jgi:hypothetical protein
MRDIGIRSALYLDGVDVTYQLGLRQFDLSETTDAVDATCFDPAGLHVRGKQFVAGLHDAKVSYDAYPDLTYDAMVTRARALFDRAATHYLLNPVTPDVGALAFFGDVLQTSWKPGIAHGAIPTLALDFQFTAGSPGLKAGFLLQSPTGSTALDVDEEHTLTFTNAPALQTFRIKATDGSDTAEFLPTDSNATIKAAIEGLDEYADYTVTVAGTLTSSTVDGITVYNGTKTVTFDPAEDVPQLLVVDSESQKLTVTAGDSGNYTLGGSANFALGDSIASIQTKVRAVGGNYASVVLGGASVAPTSGANQATTGGNASASRSSGGDVPAGAITGGHTTRWHAGSGGASWWQYDFGSVKTITEVKIRFRQTGDVINVNFQVSDDAAFGSGVTTVDNSLSAFTTTVDPNAADETYDAEVAVATPTAGRYFRINFTQSDQGQSMIRELELLDAATNGSADIYLFFPPSAGNIANAATTGTGAAVSNVTQGPGNTSTKIAVTTTTPGVGSDAIYNVVNSVTNGTTHNDIAVTETSNNGLIAQLNCIYLADGEEAQWILQHAPNSSGSPGTWATLGSFDNITETGAQQLEIAAGTEINPFLRARRTDSGGDCVVAIAAARL